MQSNTGDLPHTTFPDFPSRWQTQINSTLSEHEQIHAWLEIDLDNRLNFSSGLVVITAHRVLARMANDENWQEWLCREDMKLTCQDHAGVYSIELSDTHARLACWHCTLGRHQAVDQLISCFPD